METLIKGLLILTIVFSLSFGVCLIAKFFYLKFKEKKTDPPTNETDPKIYYIKDVAPPKKRKRRTQKKIDVAFKGVVLQPEKFKKTDES